MMNRHMMILASVVALGLIALPLNGMAAEATTPTYSIDFGDVEAGDYPMDWLILDGDFAVAEQPAPTGEAVKFLRMPGAPLGEHGALLGPAQEAGVTMEIVASIRSDNTRRRKPRFGVGLAGIGGPRLRVAAMSGKIEIARNDAPLATTPFAFTPNVWHKLRLRLERDGDAMVALGKVWRADQPEPAEWTLRHTLEQPTTPGRPSIWGAPYSGRPIDYDDIAFTVFP